MINLNVLNCSNPGACKIDRFPAYIQPLPHIPDGFLLILREGAGGMVAFKGRYGIDSPVDPESEFSIFVPLGCFIVKKGFPFRYVLL
jgi:hypothetical protein